VAKKKIAERVIPTYIVVYDYYNPLYKGTRVSVGGFNTVEDASRFALGQVNATIHLLQKSPVGVARVATDWNV
jgi:hypothetical protein